MSEREAHVGAPTLEALNARAIDYRFMSLCRHRVSEGVYALGILDNDQLHSMLFVFVYVFTNMRFLEASFSSPSSCHAWIRVGALFVFHSRNNLSSS